MKGKLMINKVPDLSPLAEEDQLDNNNNDRL